MSSTRTQIANVFEDVDKREPLYTVSENVNWCSHCGKQYGGSSKKTKNYHRIQQFHSWIYIQKKNENTNSKIYMYPMFIMALFTIAKIWKQPYCPSTDEWIKMWCIFTYTYTHTHTHNGVLLRHKKE